ncbi:MAG TPA: hypothetical protein VHY08_16630 [Bacillota bacterium]|nr:hypothetical protein [Bacillota bacterium]
MATNPITVKKTTNLTTARWFSENPNKAWGEKFFLIYSPIWILMMAISTWLGTSQHLGDIANLIQSAVIALPLIVVPFFIRNESGIGRPWYQSYWFKANLYIFIFSCFGNYFGSEYFFDVLGMVYNYPNLHLNLDSALLGSGTQHVPIIMYLLTQVYFMTYHTTAVVVLRRIKTSRIPWARWLFPIILLVVAYFWAWMETRAMATPMLQGTFYYRDINRMLSYGSLIYASYFVTSFPIFYFLDEKSDENWGLLRTIAAGLSASMLTFFLLDLWTRFIGHI